MVWEKTSTGWASLETPPLLPELLPRCIDKYIDDCLPACLKECSNAIVSVASQIESTHGLLSEAFKLWTANQLLMKGWQSDASAQCTDPRNPYYGIRPAPAVISKQLDALLESYIAGKENILLEML